MKQHRLATGAHWVLLLQKHQTHITASGHVPPFSWLIDGWQSTLTSSLNPITQRCRYAWYLKGYQAIRSQPRPSNLNTRAKQLLHCNTLMSLEINNDQGQNVSCLPYVGNNKRQMVVRCVNSLEPTVSTMLVSSLWKGQAACSSCSNSIIYLTTFRHRAVFTWVFSVYQPQLEK